jgi:flagellar hook assembly protein FlgD
MYTTPAELPEGAQALELVRALPYPNPSTNGSTYLYYELKSPVISGQAGEKEFYDPVANVTLGIYSFSRRLIWQKVIHGAKTGANSEFWEGKDLRGSPLSNGTYVYHVQVESRGKVTEKYSYVVILR